MARLDELELFRSKLDTMTLQQAIDYMVTATGNDEWWSTGIYEGGQDAWAKLFDDKLGKQEYEGDEMQEKYKYIWKIYIDNLIHNVATFGAIDKGNGIYTYVKSDKDQFAEDGDTWNALKAGRQVTIDKDGHIIDVWDPATKKTYDILGNELGARETPYPVTKDKALKSMTTAELEAARLAVVADWNEENNSKSTMVKAMKAKEIRLKLIAREQSLRDRAMHGYQKRAKKAKLPKYKEQK